MTTTCQMELDVAVWYQETSVAMKPRIHILFYYLIFIQQKKNGYNQVELYIL